MLFDLRKIAFDPSVRSWAIVLAAFFLTPGAVAHAQGASEDAGPVAAMVDGEPLYVEEINAALQTTLAGRQVDPQVLRVLQAQALDQLIDKRLVENHLAETEYAAAHTEIEESFSNIKAKVESQQIAFDEFLKKQKLTIESLRGRIRWEVSWRKYLDENLSDDALRTYFEANRAHYDGSEVAASHILLRPLRNNDPEGMAALLVKAQQIRQKIVDRDIQFADAAAQYSDGPSRKQGGKLGFFPRHGIMMEPFSKAAFSLRPGEVSEPVVTRFGVHLITVVAVRPGSRSWEEVRDKLVEPVTKSLFAQLAQVERRKVEVVYTGVIPQIRSNTSDAN